MPYNFYVYGFDIKKLQNFFERNGVLDGNRPFYVFQPLWGLQVTYAGHLRLIGKRVVDFLLVTIEFFLYGLRLRRYEEKPTEIRCFKG